MPKIALAAALLALAAGCAPLPEAPEELTELSSFLFAQQAADPRVLDDALHKLADHLVEYDLDDHRSQRSWEPALLTLDDLQTAGVAHPGRDPEDCIAVAIVGRTAHGPDLHAELATLEDQADVEPSATEYLRTFLEPEDPACFPGQTCGTLTTLNDIRRETAIYSARFELWKGFRWAGDDAIVSRTWFDRSWTGEAGNTQILQSYGVDLVMVLPDDVVRMQVAWAETDLGLAVSDDVARATMLHGIEGLFEQTDGAFEDLLLD